MDKINLPVLKAWRRIFELLGCVYDHPYDRGGFQQAVLDLYGNEKSPKSVFRGLAIPTLRNLGFIVGYGDEIHASADGTLVHAAKQTKKAEGFRALRVVLIEIDGSIGVISSLLEKQTINFDEFSNQWLGRIATSEIRRSKNPRAMERAARERLLDWIHFLNFAEILYNDHDKIRIDDVVYNQSRLDLDTNEDRKRKKYKENLFSAYTKIVNEQLGIGSVEIESLRTEVAINMYNHYGVVLTGKQFDVLLTDLPKSTREYTISFGRSIGAEEKLFLYKEKYYQTMFVRYSSE